MVLVNIILAKESSLNWKPLFVELYLESSLRQTNQRTLCWIKCTLDKVARSSAHIPECIAPLLIQVLGQNVRQGINSVRFKCFKSVS